MLGFTVRLFTPTYNRQHPYTKTSEDSKPRRSLLMYRFSKANVACFALVAPAIKGGRSR